MNDLILQLEGMHCDGCAETIEAAVGREPGVKAAAVNFRDGEARVLYDPAATSAERLIAAVGRLGYRVTRRSG
jgi:copper chaperone CopZ